MQSQPWGSYQRLKCQSPLLWWRLGPHNSYRGTSKESQNEGWGGDLCVQGTASRDASSSLTKCDPDWIPQSGSMYLLGKRGTVPSEGELDFLLDNFVMNALYHWLHLPILYNVVGGESLLPVVWAPNKNPPGVDIRFVQAGTNVFQAWILLLLHAFNVWSPVVF